MVELVPQIVMDDRRSTGPSFRMKGPVASPLGAMDSLVALASLSGCPPEVGRVLEDAEQELLDKVAMPMEEKTRQPVDMAVLSTLIDVAAKAAKISWNAEGRSGDAELLVTHLAKEMEDKMNAHRLAAAERLRQMVPRKGEGQSTEMANALAQETQ